MVAHEKEGKQYLPWTFCVVKKFAAGSYMDIIHVATMTMRTTGGNLLAEAAYS